MRAVRNSTAAAAAGVAALCSGAGLAQDAGAPSAGPRLVLDYQMELQADSNARLRVDSPGATYSFENDIGLSFRSQTPTQTLAIDSSITGRLANDPEDEVLDDEEAGTDLRQGGLDIDYTRAGARSLFTFGATYRRNEVEFVEPFFLDFDGDTIIDEVGFERQDGTVTQAALRTSLETGIDTPLSTTYSFDVRSRTYSEVTDPDLFDSRNYRGEIASELRLSPVMTGTASARYRRYDYDDVEETEGEIASVSAGIRYAVNPTLEIDASLGYSRQVEEITEGGVREEEVDEGLNASFGFVQEMPRGAIFGDLTRSVQQAGFRTSVTVGRRFEFPSSSLEASVGVTQLDDGDPGELFEIAYTRDLAEGRFAASARRRVTDNSVGDENILTSVQISYSRPLTQLTSLAVNLDVARIEEVGTEDDDQETELAFTAQVQRQLTPDWALNVGYRGRYNEDDDEDDSAVSNAVFVRLGRQFVLRP